MASESTSGGYGYDFLDAPPSELECPVCLLVMREPHLTSCCGNHFCFTCINEVRGNGKPCPLCKMDVTHTLLNRKERNRTRDLKVYCELRSSGCEWTGPLANIEAHLSVGQEVGPCQFVQVKCPLGCGREVGRKELGNHVEEDCPCRLQKCPYCEVKATGQNLVDHFSVCNKFPTVCPNSCELKSFPRCELSDHLESCPFQPVSCTFERVGCHLELRRKELKDHLDTCIQNHMEMLVEKMDLVEKRNSVLEEQLVVSEKKIVLLEERLDQYEAANVASVSRENDLKESPVEETLKEEEDKELSLKVPKEGKRKQVAKFFGMRSSDSRLKKQKVSSKYCKGSDEANRYTDDDYLGQDEMSSLRPLEIANQCSGVPCLQLKYGNIVEEVVDAIITSTDTTLKHTGGLAGVVNRASGGYLQKVTTAYAKEHGHVSTGDAIAFGSEGNLKCNYVIAVVAPNVYRYKLQMAESLLRLACMNVLKSAIQLKVTSLALPSISAGHYGMDSSVVAKVLIDTCLDYEYPKDCPLKEIRLIIFEKYIFTTFKKYFKGKRDGLQKD